MNYVDFKYVGIVSSRLDRFSVKSTRPYRANFRCPICGDSQKSKTKARGWFLEKESNAIFYCHNCGASLGLGSFLKTVDYGIYTDYIADTVLEKNTTVNSIEEIQPSTPKKTFRPTGKLITKISSLKADHPAKKYVLKRQIPFDKHYRVYYTPKFNKWVNTLLPNKLNESIDEPRLVLPFLDENKNMFGFAGRSFKKDGLRYITIMLDNGKPKVFGLDSVDTKKQYFIVEGAIDSLFLSNAVAMAGADISTDIENPENAVYVFDNEPRNSEIVSRMRKIVKQNKKVCVWPKHMIESGKDINEYVLSGLTTAEIELIIAQNTYSGISAELEISKWSVAG